jgi:hypothetical protein
MQHLVATVSKTIIGSSVTLWVLPRPGIKEWQRSKIHRRGPYPLEPGLVIQDEAHYHTSKVMEEFFDMYAERLTREQLPAYSPDFNPIEHLWKKVKKEATHLKYFPECTQLQEEVDRALLHFAQTPHEITVLMARYCESLGEMAA